MCLMDKLALLSSPKSGGTIYLKNIEPASQLDLASLLEQNFSKLALLVFVLCSSLL